MFNHIKYDEKYMPELFLTLPELQSEQNNKFLIISKLNHTIFFKMTKIRHLLNARSRGLVQNDQRGIPQLFSHAKTN